MDWRTMRDEYKRRFDEQALTQEVIAEAGGLKRQNLVSKMLRNTKLGPQVETFVRAIKGLGIQPSEFFAELERRQTGADSHDSLKPVTTLPSSNLQPVHGGHPVPSAHDLDPIVDQVLIRVGTAIATAGLPTGARKPARSVSKPRSKQRSGGKKSAANR